MPSVVLTQSGILPTSTPDSVAGVRPAIGGTIYCSSFLVDAPALADNLSDTSSANFALPASPIHSDKLTPAATAASSNARHQSAGCVMFCGHSDQDCTHPRTQLFSPIFWQRSRCCAVPRNLNACCGDSQHGIAATFAAWCFIDPAEQLMPGWKFRV